jgi:hypothetical protein
MLQKVSCGFKSAPHFLWWKALLLGAASVTLAAASALCDDTPKSSENSADHELIQELLQQIEDLKGRVAWLEAGKSGNAAAATAGSLASAAKDSGAAGSSSAAIEPVVAVAAPAASSAPAAKAAAPARVPDGGHSMEMSGGPKLNIRGFLDFNLGFGKVANPLVFPVAEPASAIHNTFQFGELDLFLNSRISNTISFLGEMIFGSDATNSWGIDIERAQVTYKPNEFLQLSAGRLHSAIGFYNTAYHHGSWFQTATGRPFMYYFEDSGGVLPVHLVGVEAAGLVPGSGKLNAHWNVEVGNGESSTYLSNPDVNPVQNFLSDKNHKAYNLSGYIKPDWFSGLQIGGNFYSDTRVPVGIPHVTNTISGVYLVYVKSPWEFLNELVLQRDHSIGSPVTYNTPLGYTQISRKFGKYRPYFRWQEVNVPDHDPLYGGVGRYEGPSFGLRMDFSDFAAVKVQYNRIYTRDPTPLNGVDTQISFTF